MILAIDAGNSRTKMAVYENNTLLLFHAIDHLQIESDIEIILKKFPKIQTIIISSVSKLNLSAIAGVFSAYKVDIISREHRFPFNNLYKTPQTLGLDRMILSSGAALKYPNVNRMVIDAGSCITFDYIDDADNYLGGAISPGLRLRYKALNSYTANLPLLETKYPECNIGDSTAEAIHAGIVNGVLHEIDAVITDFKANFCNFVIIFTGGDAEFLAIRLKNSIFANSNFLLESLVLLYNYNTKND